MIPSIQPDPVDDVIRERARKTLFDYVEKTHPIKSAHDKEELCKRLAELADDWTQNVLEWSRYMDK